MKTMQNEKSIREKIVGLFKSGKWKKIRDAINELKFNTGENCIFDPYKDPDMLLWNDVGIEFLRSGHFMEALTVFLSQLQCYLDIQEKTKRRIHKGTPYYFLGQVYLSIGNLGYAREQFLLAFVEDILTEMQSKQGMEGILKVESAFDCPAPIVLELTFRMRKEELDALYDFTKELISGDTSNKWLYPELIILKWRNFKERNKDKGLLITRAVEETLFHANPYYLKELLERAKSDKSGQSMEELATYLFSCVDGFEPIPRQQTEAFHFDIIVRNLIRAHPLLSMLGEYIGIEAKNIKDTVSAERLNHFIHKLRLHDMRCGIIFTNKGISGIEYLGYLKYGKNIQVKTFNRDNLIVFDITLDDVERIIQGNNLISILLAKYEDIRYK